MRAQNGPQWTVGGMRECDRVEVVNRSKSAQYLLVKLLTGNHSFYIGLCLESTMLSSQVMVKRAILVFFLYIFYRLWYKIKKQIARKKRCKIEKIWIDADGWNYTYIWLNFRLSRSYCSIVISLNYEITLPLATDHYNE